MSFALCATAAVAFLSMGFRWRSTRLLSGGVCLVFLSALVGYFTFREATTLAELGKFIEPVAGIDEVTYVPTAAEIGALARGLQQVPNVAVGPRRRAMYEQTRHGLRDLELEAAREPAGSRIWLVETRLSPAEVVAFYRDERPRRGFSIVAESEEWLVLERDRVRLTLFVTPRTWPDDGGASVVYTLRTLAEGDAGPR